MNGLGHGEIARLVPQRVRQRCHAQVAGLHRHDLLEVRLVPDAAGRILINTTPRRIEQMALAVDGLPRHLCRRRIATASPCQRVLDARGVEGLVYESPSALPRIVWFGVGRLDLPA